MHDQRKLLENRLSRFVTEHLHPALYRARQPVDLTWWVAPGEPVPFAEAVRQPYEPVEVGSRWGRPWGTTWIHVSGAIPDGWRVDGALPTGTSAELLVDLGFDGGPGFQTEGLAWRPDGVTIKAVSPYNNHVPLDPDAPVDIYIEAAANPDVRGTNFQPTGFGDPATAGDDPIYDLRLLEIGLRDLEVWELLRDVFTLDGLMHELPDTLPRRAEILQALSNMLDVIDPNDIPGTVIEARAELIEVLSRPAYPSAHHLIAVGHAHIDSAWLWPVRETVRKCARTFSNAIELADADPEFKFACSSAQQYAWMKEFYPELFERIREKVRVGQFLPVGGMWVESDTNMPGGEAMARQFVAGKRFFLDNFGVETEEVWLPDSFGYSAGLPQLIKASGSKYLLTQKMSWSQTNTIPHHTFWWEGIDGTRVLTHFPPVDTYGSDLSGRELARAERQYREKGKANTSLVPFGYGDGGGGPNREMVAAAKRVRSLEGSPTVTIDSPQAFFDAAAAEYRNPPTWSGEMYLELHRGTYTTQARTKQGNRRSEHLLREAELWAATAAVRVGHPYPYEELEQLWRLVLLQQFHDILPGSSIAWVHRDAERNYAAIAKRAEVIIGEAITALVGTGSRRLVLNAAPHVRLGVEPLGAAEAEAVHELVKAERSSDAIVLDNGVVRAVIDGAGRITSMVDAATQREAIAPGQVGNRLQLHRDIPNQWDAWDVDEHYRRVVTELDTADSIDLNADDEQATVIVRRTFGSSTLEQRIVLAAGSPSVEIVNDLDWHERQKLLKLGFELDVHADRSASETQFGHVFRPTHTNTSWEFARFEICAHRWLHVAEPGYGVAISNDSTYGHDVGRATRGDGGTTTTVRLSIIRSPIYPDPEADQGHHTSRVTIRPGALIKDAIEEGYRTNLQVRVVAGARDVEALVRVTNPAIVVESVKLAEDRSGDVIVRLYESIGGRASGELVPGFQPSGSMVTDLLERRMDGQPAGAGATRLDLRPFEVRTVRLTR
jgi:alpha-mannosidase